MFTTDVEYKAGINIRGFYDDSILWFENSHTIQMIGQCAMNESNARQHFAQGADHQSSIHKVDLLCSVRDQYTR